IAAGRAMQCDLALGFEPALRQHRYRAGAAVVGDELGQRLDHFLFARAIGRSLRPLLAATGRLQHVHLGGAALDTLLDAETVAFARSALRLQPCGVNHARIGIDTRNTELIGTEKLAHARPYFAGSSLDQNPAAVAEALDFHTLAFGISLQRLR